MTNKEIKSEARKKLALNMHQAIILYTIQFAIYSMLISLVVMATMCLGTANKAAAIVMICYGILLLLLAFIGSGMLSFAMVDYYLTSYKCKAYNIHRLGETLARGGMTKILLLNVKRILLGFLLTLCGIIPGIFYFIRTSMANHLLIANPKLTASGALKASSSVMSGKTGAYFSLVASMFGWYVLGVITLGLGFIFIMPYLSLTKTVYYKRSLQGDKTEYKFVPTVQGQTPPNQQISQQMRTVNMQQSAPNQAQQPDIPARPIVIENSPQMPPIDTLGSEDIAEMREAMRELGLGESEFEPIVPEVPISPVGTQPRKTSSRSRSGERADVVDAVTPIDNDFVDERNVDDSDFVEIVKPMTTQEVDDANVMSKRINNMFSQTTPQEQVRKDYISKSGTQNPNDFVTQEVELADEPVAEVGVVGIDNLQQSDDDFATPPISDEAFDAFLKAFDMPDVEEEFKPITRTKTNTSSNNVATDNGDGTGMSERLRSSTTQNTALSRRAVTHGRSTSGSRTSESLESRVERLRREREERLKKSNNNNNGRTS